MERIKPRTLSGFMELLPAQQQQMERVMDILRTTYSRYGFTPLDTPIIEASEILLAKGGGETEKQIYRFSKGDSDLSLRFDLTVPLAKYVALHYNELAFPFRRFQIGKVYRGERAQRGRFREFYQADIDVIGDGELDIMNDAEIPAIIYDVFSAMGLKRFQIRINNRRVLNGFYSMLGLTEQSGEIMRTVDKIEKIGPDMVRAILVDDVKLTDEQADEILKFIAITGTNEEVLAALKGYCGRDELFDRGYEELSTVIKYLGGFGVAQENFKVDLLRRPLRQPRRVLYRPQAAGRGHLHRRDAPVLCARRAGPSQRRAQHRARGRAASANDGRSELCRLPRHPTARARPACSALHREQEVQGQDELRRQDEDPLRSLPRRGRGRLRRRHLQGHGHR